MHSKIWHVFIQPRTLLSSNVSLFMCNLAQDVIEFNLQYTLVSDWPKTLPYYFLAELGLLRYLYFKVKFQ